MAVTSGSMMRIQDSSQRLRSPRDPGRVTGLRFKHMMCHRKRLEPIRQEISAV